MTTVATVTEKTYKWLVSSLPNGANSDADRTINLIVQCVKEKIGEAHIPRVAMSGIAGMFVIEATNRAMEVLQIQAFISDVRPHPTEFDAYEIEITSDMSRTKLIRSFSKLRALIPEFMMDKDIVRMVRRGNRVYAVCSPRGRTFLSGVAFLSAPKRIK